MIKKLQRTYGQRIFSLKEAAIAQKANVSSPSSSRQRIKELVAPALLGFLKNSI